MQSQSEDEEVLMRRRWAKWLCIGAFALPVATPATILAQEGRNQPGATNPNEVTPPGPGAENPNAVPPAQQPSGTPGEQPEQKNQAGEPSDTQKAPSDQVQPPAPSDQNPAPGQGSSEGAPKAQ
jgi:hypothetical protein